MDEGKVFLAAEWNDLLMINYSIDPEVLKPFLPTFTEIDLEDGHCYISMVGFRFEDVRLKNISIPFHRNFPEVNLRFYVRRFDGKKWRRGVVFISEIVPLPAISFIANSFYGEKYKTLPMRASRVLDQDILSLKYSWRFRGTWQSLEVSASTKLKPLESVPGADFITNHFWGYSRRSSTLTHEYHVSHPSWNLYPVVSAAVKCDFKNLYGDSFAFLQTQEPASIFLAQGSPVKIFHKSLIRSVAG